MTPPPVEQLWNEAIAVRQRAHAPYSGYSVGAALSVQGDDRIFAGCNVENASYGATICAERNAVFQAVSATQGTPVIDQIVLVTQEPAPPCGMCLQVLAEFSTPETRIVLASPTERNPEVPLSTFLPHPFSPNSLSDHV